MADASIFKIRYGYKKAFLALTTETKKQIVSRFVGGESLVKISKDLGIHRQAATAAVSEQEIPTNRNIQRWLSLDENAFSVITPESAYWIGFLMADGCVKGNAVMLGLQHGDIGHVRKFKEFLKSGHKVEEFKRETTFKDRTRYKTISSVCRLQFRSQKIVDDLAKYGITPNKSLTAKVIGLENNTHFWRGVIDGDGSIGETINQGTLGNVPWPVVTLCGSADMIQQFIDFVNILHPNKRRIHKESGRNLYNARYVCKTAIKIIEALYKDAPISLDRKQSKANELMQYRDFHYPKSS